MKFRRVSFFRIICLAWICLSACLLLSSCAVDCGCEDEEHLQYELGEQDDLSQTEAE